MICGVFRFFLRFWHVSIRIWIPVKCVERANQGVFYRGHNQPHREHHWPLLASPKKTLALERSNTKRGCWFRILCTTTVCLFKPQTCSKSALEIFWKTEPLPLDHCPFILSASCNIEVSCMYLPQISQNYILHFESSASQNSWRRIVTGMYGSPRSEFAGFERAALSQKQIQMEHQKNFSKTFAGFSQIAPKDWIDMT